MATKSGADAKPLRFWRRASGRSAERRVFSLAASIPWAITSEYLQLILSIASRQHDRSLDAVEAEMGRPLDNTRTTEIRDGVAIIPVTGPIFRYASLFSRVSGATSIDDLALDFTAALNDPDVSAILLQVDSPGGEVNGTSEFAHMIYAARGEKPIAAYVDGLGCSAAYWIASACDRIVVADTALTGSIGVIATFEADPDSPDPIEIVSSQSPKKDADPKTADGRAQIQAMLDRLAGVFIGAVALHRGVSTETVLSDFGQGGVFVGADGVAAGLADAVGSFEGVLASLATGQDPAPARETTDDDDLPQITPDDPILADPAQPPVATAATDTEFPERINDMNLKEFLKRKAAEDGIEIDAETPAAAADVTAAHVAPDLSAYEAQIRERDAEITRLREIAAGIEAETAATLAQAEEERRVRAAASYTDTLVASHRLNPAAAEALTPIVASVMASATEGVDVTAQLDAFASSLPDLSLFVTEQVKSEAAVVLAAAQKTEVPGEETASEERRRQLLAATPVGRKILAEQK